MHFLFDWNTAWAGKRRDEMEGLKRFLELVAAIGAMEDMDEIRRLVLQTIREVIGFDTANFWLYPPTRKWAEHIVIDTPNEYLLQYFMHYADIDEFHRAYNTWGNVVIARSTDLLDYSDWLWKSEYYNDFLRRHSTYYLLAFDIKDSSGIYGAICLHRAKSCRDFSNEERSLLSLLYPHLLNRLRWFSEKESLLMQLEAKITATTSAPWSDSLTAREREIAQQVLAGASNLEIAKNLGISINTVKMHLQNVFAKLDIRRRNQLFQR